MPLFAWALTSIAALGSLGLGALLYLRIRSPLMLPLWPLKILAGSLAAFVVAVGAAGALAGLWLRAPLAVLAGAAGAALAAHYIRRVKGYHGQVEKMLWVVPQGGVAPCRIVGGRKQARWERDVPFWTLAEGDRPLLCDIWQPPPGVPPSGVAVVYFHSSAWHLAGKDVWTRPLFRRLAGSGHVVMDVGYRLCPEADLCGMLGDARRAIAWMKASAARYGVDPRRVVAAGASAGGHLALLAAYTPGHPELTPEELRGVDTSVRAVVSFYGLADMRAYYDHVGAILPAGRILGRLAAGPLSQAVGVAARLLPGLPFAEQTWKLGSMSNCGIMANLLGGSPDEVPAMYDLASPIAHAGPHCPPTLLIQGEHDAAIPPAATRALYRKLVAAGVPVAALLLPQTDHLFDLVLPQVSPAARVALAELDRFLALVA